MKPDDLFELQNQLAAEQAQEAMEMNESEDTEFIDKLNDFMNNKKTSKKLEHFNELKSLLNNNELCEEIADLLDYDLISESDLFRLVEKIREVHNVLKVKL